MYQVVEQELQLQLLSNKEMVEVYCRGGKYIIEKDYYRWTMEAENIS